MSEDALARARDVIAGIREGARARFGWAHVAVEVEHVAGGLALRGEVVATRQIHAIERQLAHELPGVDVDVRGIVTLRSGSWHALARSPIALTRGAPGSEQGGVRATELVFGDGPVERMGDQGGSTLVRVVDGTLGWMEGPLGPRTTAPCLQAPPFDADAFASEARHWLGVAYRLGGTTPSGIDCSALAQRCLRAAGALAPRHSADQLAIGDAEGEGDRDVGDLVMLWAADEAPCHVALAIAPDRLVHASRSRARVVDERRDELLARATRVRHVPRASIQALQRELVGFACLADVLALGKPPQ